MSDDTQDVSYIAPLDSETASKVLEAAEAAGVDASRVLTSSFPAAFVVPPEVEDKYHDLFDADQAKKTPKASAKKS